MKTNRTIITKSIQLALVATAFASVSAGAATLANKNKFYGTSTAGGGYHVFVSDHPGQTSYALRGYAKAYGKIFNRQVEIAKADGRATSYMNETGRITADIRVFGVSVWDYAKTGSTTFNESFEWIKEQTVANLDFPVGPITINVKGGVSIEARADIELKIEALDPNSTVYTPVIKGSLKPKFDAALTASGGINAWVVKPNLQANLTLVKVEMPTEASLRPVLQSLSNLPVATGTLAFASSPGTGSTRGTISMGSFTMNARSTSTLNTYANVPVSGGRTFVAAWDADLKLSTLGGKLDAVVEYFNPSPWNWGWKTYRTTLFSWNGITSNIDLASGSKEITLGANTGMTVIQ